MTREEMLKRIDELESLIFELDMKDFWNENDRTLNWKWNRELGELKRAVRK